jgi:hypothetical protein
MRSTITPTPAKVLRLGLLLASLATHPAFAQDSAASYHPKRANLENENASEDASRFADWIVDSGNNHTLPFVIVDKTDAKVFVFFADGRLRGAAPALLGLAVGDNSVPGIGTRKLASIRPEERTTPAGRFVASLGRNAHGVEVLWVDYAGAISLHRVITSNPKEQRAQRLATPTPLDNRISYGCINVPVKFYEKVVHPAFAGTSGIVYVLPETKSAHEVFGSYDVDERADRRADHRASVGFGEPPAALATTPGERRDPLP